MKVTAPWDQEVVDKLNNYQRLGIAHPYTCDRGANECETKVVPRDYAKDGVLKATKEGWVCPCGKYKQDWAWGPCRGGGVL